MTRPRVGRCADCAHWSPPVLPLGQTDVYASKGTCRWGPPTPDLPTRWPVTWADEGCGAHEPIPAPPPVTEDGR